MGTNIDSRIAGRREANERRRSLIGRRWTDGLRRTIDQRAENIEVGSLRICDQQKKVFIDGEEKQLTPTEYELLRVLAENEGQVCSTEELALGVWHHKQSGGAAKVKQYVYLLRKKIEPDPHSPRWIRSIKGFGYALVVNT
ncbi:MAG: winged helix-turn-helix domain-containing protein [Gammaproteobacteria bacterium]|nr:winged helix-turn-helix domain-containing protein [Gammaproteobacteria bacterium]MDH3464611.1 winged helix-turn-helix domain-containing protein [Gammaproteobacteria bacterium]